MPIFYQMDRQIAKMQAKTTDTSKYLSDQKKALYGGRGGRDEEIDYLSSISTNKDKKLSDAWQGFGSSQGISGKRDNETKRKFFEEGVFP